MQLDMFGAESAPVANDLIRIDMLPLLRWARKALDSSYEFADRAIEVSLDEWEAIADVIARAEGKSYARCITPEDVLAMVEPAEAACAAADLPGPYRDYAVFEFMEADPIRKRRFARMSTLAAIVHFGGRWWFLGACRCDRLGHTRDYEKLHLSAPMIGQAIPSVDDYGSREWLQRYHFRCFWTQGRVPSNPIEDVLIVMHGIRLSRHQAHSHIGLYEKAEENQIEWAKTRMLRKLASLPQEIRDTIPSELKVQPVADQQKKKAPSKPALKGRVTRAASDLRRLEWQRKRQMEELQKTEQAIALQARRLEEAQRALAAVEGEG